MSSTIRTPTIWFSRPLNVSELWCLQVSAHTGVKCSNRLTEWEQHCWVTLLSNTAAFSCCWNYQKYETNTYFYSVNDCYQVIKNWHLGCGQQKRHINSWSVVFHHSNHTLHPFMTQAIYDLTNIWYRQQIFSANIKLIKSNCFKSKSKVCRQMVPVSALLLYFGSIIISLLVNSCYAFYCFIRLHKVMCTYFNITYSIRSYKYSVFTVGYRKVQSEPNTVRQM